MFRPKANAICIALAALTLATIADPALADHRVINAPQTQAGGSSSIPSANASTTYANGALVGGAAGGPGASETGGGNGLKTFAQTTAGSSIFGNVSYAEASLTAGTLKASTISSGPDFFGFPTGTARAMLTDTLFFTNTSAAAQAITLSYRFDGRLLNPYPDNGNPGGNLSLALSCLSGGCFNDTGDRIVFGTGPTQTPNNNWNYYFDFRGNNCFGENIFCGQGSAPFFQFGLDQPTTGGVIDGFISTQLLIPTGLSSIGITGSLAVGCSAGSSCLFGNTAKFGFDPLPEGLSYSSASGAFLTEAGPGAVPEPATWAMMLMGFGLMGSVLRAQARAARLGFA